MPLHIISPTRGAYLDYNGSSNETAHHVRAGSPVTRMVCSFAAETFPAFVFSRGDSWENTLASGKPSCAFTLTRRTPGDSEQSPRG